jgi:hypothetical protein
MPLPEEPAHRTPPRPPQRPEPSRTEPKPEPPKPDPPAAEPSKPAEELLKLPATPPTTLQTTPAIEEGGVERSIREAKADLSRIDYRVLNIAARNQYDTAKRFVEQAEQAISDRNLGFAKTLAEKAAALAAKLAGK